MDGTAAAGELTAARRHAVPRGASRHPERACRIDTAGPEDDEAIRRLLRENVFPGEIRLSFEREPDSFAAAAIEGDVHQTIVARARPSGRVVAMAGRSVRDAHVNGRPVRLGYFGQLRIEPAFLQRRVLDDGFARGRALHDAGDARVYLLSVVAANRAVRRMLERRHAGWPAMEAADLFVTLAIPVAAAASRRWPAGVQTVSGRDAGFRQIVECLGRASERHQFAPCWTTTDLESPIRTPDLDPGDFAVAIRDGRVVGCLACWDQRTFKQVVVRGYSRRLAFWRPAINLLAGWTGVPRLPPSGARLEFAYLSHVAVDEDDADVFEALVIEGCRHGLRKGVEYVAIGLSSRSPLLTRAQHAFGHRAYESMLYAACWPDGERLVRELDGRPSNPELAIL